MNDWARSIHDQRQDAGVPLFFIKKINMVISSKTYNPDCDPVQDDTQKELDQLDRPAEPDATERANILSSPVTADVTVNAILKRKLEIAMRGLDEYGDEDRWDDLDGKYRYCRIFRGEAAHGYELAQRIKAEIEEVK